MTHSHALHFIVRHPSYMQTPGYGAFMGNVLASLNQHPPQDARTLLLGTAQRMAACDMLARDTKKDEKALATALFPALQREWYEARQSEGADKADQRFFGPVVNQDFGAMRNELIRRAKDAYDAGRESHAGWTLITPIGNDEASSYRGYFEIFKKNQPEVVGGRVLLPLQFSYPVPGEKEPLPLMRVDHANALRDTWLSWHETRTSDDQSELLAWYDHEYGKDNKLLFLHPNFTPEYFEKLVKCMQPLLDTISTPPEEHLKKGAKPPRDKEDALITMYWLLAQTTPVQRGGSAMANVVREHLAERLRAQGYDYTVPYTQPGVDMWAEAASSKLEQFKALYHSGIFFDTKATDATIADFLRQRLEAQRGNALEVAPADLMRGEKTHAEGLVVGRVTEPRSVRSTL
jgi:hypothetical protein